MQAIKTDNSSIIPVGGLAKAFNSQIHILILYLAI